MNHLGTVPLQTERLLLRPFTLADAELMFRNWASDPEVTKYLTWPAHADISVTESVLRDWVESYVDGGFYQWAIVPKTLGEPIGSISAVHVDNATESVEVGYCIGQRSWHQGIMSEVLARVIRFFFEEVGANRVSARHDLRNPHSGDVMKKCGMTYEGTLRRAGRNNQGLCDECCYSILAEEYKERSL